MVALIQRDKVLGFIKMLNNCIKSEGKLKVVNGVFHCEGDGGKGVFSLDSYFYKDFDVEEFKLTNKDVQEINDALVKSIFNKFVYPDLFFAEYKSENYRIIQFYFYGFSYEIKI